MVVRASPPRTPTDADDVELGRRARLPPPALERGLDVNRRSREVERRSAARRSQSAPPERRRLDGEVSGLAAPPVSPAGFVELVFEGGQSHWAHAAEAAGDDE
jgi:hypothetical protein